MLEFLSSLSSAMGSGCWHAWLLFCYHSRSLCSGEVSVLSWVLTFTCDYCYFGSSVLQRQMLGTSTWAIFFTPRLFSFMVQLCKSKLDHVFLLYSQYPLINISLPRHCPLQSLRMPLYSQLFFTVHLNEITYYSFFCAWIISLKIMIFSSKYMANDKIKTFMPDKHFIVYILKFL